MVPRIPGMGEPGGLPSVGSHRVGHDWSDLAAVAAGTVMAPLGVSFSLLTEDQGLVEVDLFAILDPFDSKRFMLYP